MHGPNTLQVWIESAFVHIVGVAHMVTHHWFFATDFTYLCHFSAPLEVLHPMVAKGVGVYIQLLKRPHRGLRKNDPFNAFWGSCKGKMLWANFLRFWIFPIRLVWPPKPRIVQYTPMPDDAFPHPDTA